MNEPDNKKFSKGTLIAFECGEYSGFEFLGILVTLQDVDLRVLAQTMTDEEASKDEWDRGGYKSFMAWLVVQGYAAPIDYTTVYLGDYEYAGFDEDFEVKKGDDEY